MRRLLRTCAVRVSRMCAIAAMAMSGVAAPSAFAQAPPCRYEVADIIEAPPCGITGPPATQANAISPNGRYVAGTYAQCGSSDDEAFIYDRQTREFRTLPRPTGMVSMWANDV